MTAKRADLRTDRVLLSATGDCKQQTEVLLTDARLKCHVCDNCRQFCDAILDGGGVGVIQMELLTPQVMKQLVDTIARQESWSDFPLIVLCRASEESASAGLRMLHLLEPLGNVTILHEPVSALSFISAVEAGLRSRRSQFQVRDGIKRWNHMLQDREHFLSLLAHEVRNPLSSLQNAAEILGRVDPLTTTASEQRTLIQRQTTRLALLIEEVLNAFQLESRRMRLRREPINLVSVVARALAGVANESAAKRQELRFPRPDQPVIVNGDLDRLHLVFADLLMHAIRCSPPGSTVEASIGVVGERAEVAIRDSCGVATADELQKLFEPSSDFNGSIDHSPDRGMPFGLALVEGLVKLHGGQVLVAPDAEHLGCVVRISLPLSPVADTGSRSLTKSDSGSRRVLVIEDNVDGRESLKMLLELWGHIVETASDGADGLAKLNSHVPDIALIDIGLPAMSGYDIVRHLRQANIPMPRLIAMTGYGQPHDRELALEVGFDSFFVKPIDSIHLHDILAAVPLRCGNDGSAAERQDLS
jgi:two-component system, sensor histidine kinase